ncbi:glycosyltransferase [Oscillatoria sp. FACHB-1407]|uniref:glycosyltransferase family 2 protein n=1 Tax=Oscillatoria sp. FACHB-1407 TaxID=2692847 RepID=UPI0016843AFB|nr:glycosyltransferase family 2 protein [Oscillatoria sp. FACHB-1407]MBD2464224.1 glycosyltransferase [Oscillatoria sp. FACHB-1407]
MKISIITVCRNSEAYIEKAIKSVLAQTYDQIEYIVIDGASTDKTVDLISQYKSSIHKFVSEPDSGIYQAMNKGIRMATGSYIYFLNSDDYLVDDSVIEDVAIFLQNNPLCHIVYGDLEVRNSSGKTQLFKPPAPQHVKDFMIYGSMPHQATFASAEVFSKWGFFNESYKAVSDVEWYLKTLSDDSIHWCYYPRTIASYYLEGFSARNVRSIRAEFWEVQNNASLYQTDAWLKARIQKFQAVITDFEEQIATYKCVSEQSQELVQSLNKAQQQVHSLETELKRTQEDLNIAKERIFAMETSKFWKLRKQWFQIKKILGLPLDE